MLMKFMLLLMIDDDDVELVVDVCCDVLLM